MKPRILISVVVTVAALILAGLAIADSDTRKILELLLTVITKHRYPSPQV